MKKGVKILGVISLMTASFIAGAIVEGKLRGIGIDDNDCENLNNDTDDTTDDDIDYEIRDERLEDDDKSAKKDNDKSDKEDESDSFFDEGYYEKLI